MVVFRLAQGVFGAPLVPLSQAILLDVFPRNRAGQALAIFGLGIMVAPVIGPALGGYLTETYSWRTVFYINVPIGLFALLMSIGYLPTRAIKDIKTDWVGMGLLVLAVGALQFVLDQGQMRDWFNSRLIVVGAIIAVFATAAFFLRGWNKPDNIIDLSLLKDRNFVAGTLAITAYGISLFGWMALMPLFSQTAARLFAGARRHAVHPARASSAPSRWPSPAASSSSMFDARYLVAAGLVMTALGTLLDGAFHPLCGLLGHRHAGHLVGHRHRPVLRAAHRRRLRQHSRKANSTRHRAFTR